MLGEVTPAGLLMFAHPVCYANSWHKHCNALCFRQVPLIPAYVRFLIQHKRRPSEDVVRVTAKTIIDAAMEKQMFWTFQERILFLLLKVAYVLTIYWSNSYFIKQINIQLYKRDWLLVDIYINCGVGDLSDDSLESCHVRFLEISKWNEHILYCEMNGPVLSTWNNIHCISLLSVSS